MREVTDGSRDRRCATGIEATMRRIVLAALLASAACGGDGPSKSDASMLDLAASATSDLAAQQSCGQIFSCTTSANTPLLFGACCAAGTAAAQHLYMSLYECALARCAHDDGGVRNDGGTGACTSASDDTVACNACVHDAEASAACSSQLTACESS